jgi:hypothetical protein
MEIHEFYVTFGVQYGRRPDDLPHPQGMFSDGYAVIEAPDMETARAMTFAAFDDKYAFVYPSRPESRHVPAGELLRIKWLMPESTTYPNTGIVPSYILDRIEGHEDDHPDPQDSPGFRKEQQ